MKTDAALRVEGLNVIRQGNHIIPDLSFSLPAGSITGLLGPSGSGKTTVLRAIIGVQKFSSGSIELLGRPAGHPELRRRVAYTSQSLSIYRDISVRANVEYFAALAGASAADARQALARVEMAEYAQRRVDSLSGGQASRVSLACALVGAPEFLILDEPTVGLDPVTRRALWETFHAIAAGGATLLISSHVMDEAARCDAVMLLRDGRLLAHAPIAEIERSTGTTTAEDAFLALIEGGSPA
ncbi:ABC transporter ATP-binding protein [Corynebacterium guangdongense]|uniref:ABC-2 type transport system ATP-binding protein n=1 Tax=Corynebacterium guangdongense TaxID=1783348 RepID=A0ABU1ZUM9_9CORY|nr:ABC transporter ATP-binding protein [Corynebacterium guangdongense]MDR7328637.1 ABC-2 type transport system ATP-binding protein [Corynebacterium guangdongense]WJZ17214.1 putative ABC transporter ATP-binding protein YbhF [Corynebacterium guangdongense]